MEILQKYMHLQKTEIKEQAHISYHLIRVQTGLVMSAEKATLKQKMII